MAYSNPQQGVDVQEVRRLRKKAGEILRHMRISIGKTQRDVAADLELDYYTMISQIESGKGRVPPTQIEAYAKSLKVEPRELAIRLMEFYDPINYDLIFNAQQEAERTET